MAVTSNINGDITVDGVFVGNFNTDPSLLYASEAQLLEGIGLPSGTPQDAPGGPVRDRLIEPDDPFAEDDTYDPFNVNPVVDFINTITQPVVNLFPDWDDGGDPDPQISEFTGGSPMGMDYGSLNAGPQPSMCKLALMNKALIAIVQAGAVTSAGNPLLGVVGSILSNGLKRLGVGSDWGRRIFGPSQDAENCQRYVEEAIAVGYLRIPKPNEDGSLPARMQVTLDPDSPRATLQWRRKAAPRRAAVRRATPRRTTYRRTRRSS